MTDIFDEVEQDLRRERLKAVWDRFGPYVIAIAVLIVVIVAGWRGYEAWQSNRAQEAGDTFATVIAEADVVETESVAADLLAFADEAPDGYALLARMRAATAYHQAGATERASELFAAIAADASTPELYRDLASIRLAQIELDAGNYAAAEQAAGPLAENSLSTFHRSAQEIMGVIAYAQADYDEAERWFTTLSEAAGVAPSVRQRADVMVALLAQNDRGEAPIDASAGPGTADEPTSAADAEEETN